MVYLDETGISQKIMRESGWAECGKQIHERVSGKREKRIHGIAAYTQGHIIAPLLSQCRMNTSFFNLYRETLLVTPTPSRTSGRHGPCEFPSIAENSRTPRTERLYFVVLASLFT